MGKKTYFGVDNKSRKVKKLYIGVNSKARKVKKGYIGVGGKARLCFSGERNQIAYSHSTEKAYKEINLDTFTPTGTILPDKFIPNANIIKDDIYLEPSLIVHDVKSDVIIKNGISIAVDFIKSKFTGSGYSYGVSGACMNDRNMYAAPIARYNKNGYSGASYGITKHDYNTLTLVNSSYSSWASSQYTGASGINILIASTNNYLYYLVESAYGTYNKQFHRCNLDTLARLNVININNTSSYLSWMYMLQATRNNLYCLQQTGNNSDYHYFRELDINTMANIRASKSVYDLNRIRLISFW